MAYACLISEQIAGFKQTEKVITMLEKYKLPTFVEFNKNKVFNVLAMDKKRQQKNINYIMLEKIGKAVIKSIPLSRLQKIIGDL
jgi:3-dehydroquinate synthase